MSRAAAQDSALVVVIDNYDSFVYILVQYLGELGARPVVYRNDTIDVDGISAIGADGILLSPGPGTPDNSGVSMAVLAAFSGVIPIFGVCLGMQCIGKAFGGEVVRAPQVMHGKTSLVRHNGTGVFAGLPQPFEATRYHSLIVDRRTVGDDLEVTAETDDGTVMGLRHYKFDVQGVQFHPESVLTTSGNLLVANFVNLCKANRRRGRHRKDTTLQ